MTNTYSRLRTVLTSLFLLFLFQFSATAEEITPQVYIAVDQKSMLPLAGVLAYQAEQSGAAVSMFNIFQPENDPFYTSGEGITVADGLSAFKGYKLQDSDKNRHLSKFLSIFVDHHTLPESLTDFYILSGYERDKLVYGSWDDKENRFENNNLHNAYSAVSAVMNEHSQINLHFIYRLHTEGNRTALDAKLQETDPKRVQICVCSAAPDIPEVITSILTPAASHVFKKYEEQLLSKDGEIPHSVSGLSELICLGFPSEAAPVSIEFVPDEQFSSENNAIPAHIYDTEESNEKKLPYWLAIPSHISGKIRVQYESEVPDDAVYSMSIWSEIPEFDIQFELLDALDQSILPDENNTYLIHSEKNTCHVSILNPCFDTNDIRLSLTAVLESQEVSELPAGESTVSASPTEKASIHCFGIPSETSPNQWAFTIDPQALTPNTNGTFSLHCEVWNQEIVNQKTEYSFFIENRAPVLTTSSNEYKAYYDVPGAAIDEITLDLKDYIYSSDTADSLAFKTERIGMPDPPASDDNSVYVHRVSKHNHETALTITATDAFQESAQRELKIIDVSVLRLLNELKLICNNPAPTYEVSILEKPTLQFEISDDNSIDLIYEIETALSELRSLGYLDADQPVSLESYLTLSVNDQVCSVNSDEKDGRKILRFTCEFAESETSNTPIPLEYAVSFKNTQLSIDPSAPEFLSYKNQTPRLLLATPSEAQKDISGSPGNYKPVKLSELFGTIDLSNLFSNAETNEPLDYIIEVSGGSSEILHDSSSYSVQSHTISTKDNVPLTLDVNMSEPGEYCIKIYARDSEEQDSEAKLYFVTLKSSFIRTLIITLSVAAVLLIIIAVIMIIRYIRKPSFTRAYMDISNLRKMIAFPWENPAAYTTLPLESYGKQSVSLLSLLAAAGQVPPRTCSPKELSRISIIPGKENNFHVICRGSFVKNITLKVNNRTIDGARCSVTAQHTLFICFNSPAEEDMLTIRIYHR